MFKTYTASFGDTFELISRKNYGTEQSAATIKLANPGVYEPIQSGAQILIPANPNDPVNILQSAPSDGENETSVLIRGRRLRYWDKIVIKRQLDSMDQISLTSPFEPDNPDHREVFRPFAFDPIEVNISGDPLFTGRIIPVRPKMSNAGKSVSVAAYSEPGLMNDCSIPASKAPVEFVNQNLRKVATSLAEPFGVGVQFDDDPGPAFEQVAISSNQRVLLFLSKLAKQRGLVMSSTERGKLLFQKSITADSVPVATFTQGQSPLFEIETEFNEQEYYSSITGVEPSWLFFEGQQFTVQNPYLQDIQRPKTIKLEDVRGGDIQTAVLARMGRMFANTASYKLTIPTWRDPQGNLWEPNTAVIVDAPGVMVYEPYKFIIRSAQLAREGNSETAVLTLIMPGGFSGQVPDSLPWGAQNLGFAPGATGEVQL